MGEIPFHLLVVWFLLPLTIYRRTMLNNKHMWCLCFYFPHLMMTFNLFENVGSFYFRSGYGYWPLVTRTIIWECWDVLWCQSATEIILKWICTYQFNRDIKLPTSRSIFFDWWLSHEKLKLPHGIHLWSIKFPALVVLHNYPEFLMRRLHKSLHNGR